MKTSSIRRLAWAALLVVACDKPKPPVPKASDAGQVAAPVVRARPAPAAGETPLDIDKSKLSLSMVKDNDQDNPVTATMRMRDGAVSIGAGTARLTIDLDSFESNIHVRNERVRGIFFETDAGASAWDSAELTIPKIPEDVLSAVRDKKRVSRAKLDGSVKLHGATAKLAMVIDAGFADNGALWIKSTQPVEVKVSDFGLGENLKKLATTCKHDSIDDVIKVDVALELMPP